MMFCNWIQSLNCDRSTIGVRHRRAISTSQSTHSNLNNKPLNMNTHTKKEYVLSLERLLTPLVLCPRCPAVIPQPSWAFTDILHRCSHSRSPQTVLFCFLWCFFLNKSSGITMMRRNKTATRNICCSHSRTWWGKTKLRRFRATFACGAALTSGCASARINDS